MLLTSRVVALTVGFASLSFAQSPVAVQTGILLTSGVKTDFSFLRSPPDPVNGLYNGIYSFRVQVPQGSTSLTARVVGTPPSGPDNFYRVYLRFGQDNSQATFGGPIMSDYASPGDAFDTTLTVPSPSKPPLQVGTYYVSLFMDVVPFIGTQIQRFTGNITATVTGPACAYSLSPSTVSVPADGGSGNLTITTSTGCPWAAVSDSAWLLVSGLSSNGSGTVSYLAVANPSVVARTAKIIVAGQSTTFNQAGAPPTPTISSATSGASFQPGIASGSWITIKGTNLSSTTRIWVQADFKGNTLPLSLDGVSVKVNNKDAPVYSISPTELNVLAPVDTDIGIVGVTVATAAGTSIPLGTTLQALAPAFFANLKSVLARHADGCWVAENAGVPSPVYPVAPATPDSPVCALRAATGETLGLVGTGFGPLGSDAAGTPLVAPTDRDYSDSYWPPDPTTADQTDSPTPMFPLLDPTAIQLSIGDKILPVLTGARTRPGIDVVWVTIPADIIATTETVTWYDIKGSMWGNQFNTVQMPVQTAPPVPPSSAGEFR